MLICLTSMTPAFAFADETKPAQTETPFCETLPETAATLEKRIADKENKTDDESIAKEAENRSQARDQKIDQVRAALDDKREKNIAALLASATTDGQRAAVIAFKNALIDAVTARRTAIDAAFDAYDAAVVKLFSQNTTAADRALAGWKTSVTAALDKAKDDCANDKDVRLASKAYQERMNAAKKALYQNRSAILRLRDSVKAFADDRKEAVDAAEAEYKASVASALTTLKTTLAAK